MNSTQHKSAITARLKDYALLLRLNRPIGGMLLLWPTLWALWFAADGRPSLNLLAVFVLGVFLMRSAGCAINDFADRNFDPHVERTRNRPLAARRIQPEEALGLFIVLSLLAFALVLTLNWLTIALAGVGAFLAITYPFLKRWTHLPQLYLGVAFGWGIPMAFAAQTGTVPAIAWILLAANICWAVAYDTAYGMADRPDDLRVGVKSTAVLFGEYDRLMVGLFHAATLALLIVVGFSAQRGLLYYGGLVVASTFALYEQRLIRDRQRDECFRAWVDNNRFGAAVFIGIVLDYLVTA